MTQSPNMIDVVVKRITSEATGISSFELHPCEGDTLPAFTAGAHIDIRLENGLVRSYSLINSQRETGRYLIAVNLDRNSRGGSRFMHERVRVGDRLAITEPSNNFPLDESASHSVFIAGGIGITPIWAMIQRQIELGGSWEVHYACRAAEYAAFLEQITAAGGGDKVKLHLDEESGGRFLDMKAIVDHAPENSIFYCCGPAAMLEAYKQATAGIAAERVRLEHFGVAPADPGTGGEFTVVLAKSGDEFLVEEGMTILETLLQNGISHNYSCTQGVCGTCLTPVLEGVPDHRDWVLSDERKASNEVMLICCSLSKTERLVLDL
ncbi:2,3,5,6-tetrachlorobenzoquinone reductase [Novosphingobium resinovorum]|uniref:2,3,5,6-tetrachlorobenzoquinone reductase n=2 Tax=Novosphingobium TaxID=165696 RepID=A0A031K4N6_9SPHN|nr:MULTISPECIES: PDR/VanB family oxidoreductase [Novosphingobium]AGJ94016.1 2,3,5,6-tetrachlorobenzoquinone reductase [Novosphingobium lentum NBRC 107847]EZP83978.1 2,3,5,6-tetrachlorobenzoquinone reductase [Novosphingobium resinovorum]